MYCVKCGNEIVQGQKFCTRCGTPVPAAQKEEKKNGPVIAAPVIPVVPAIEKTQEAAQTAQETQLPHLDKKIAEAQAHKQDAPDLPHLEKNPQMSVSEAQDIVTMKGTDEHISIELPDTTQPRAAADETPAQVTPNVPVQEPVYAPQMQQPVYTPPVQQAVPQQPVYTPPVQQPVYTPPVQQAVPQQPVYTPPVQTVRQQPVYTPPVQQPVYTPQMQQPVYNPVQPQVVVMTPPAVTPPPVVIEKKSNGAAVAGLVFGIITLILYSIGAYLANKLNGGVFSMANGYMQYSSGMLSGMSIGSGACIGLGSVTMIVHFILSLIGFIKGLKNKALIVVSIIGFVLIFINIGILIGAIGSFAQMLQMAF